MTAQELRIGNYVIYEATTHVIYTLLRENVFHHWIKATDEFPPYQSSYNEIEGIPLTSGWLERFGFRQSKDEWSVIVLDLGWLYLGSMLTNDSVTLFEKSGISTGLTVTTVHQLQNLYFALTGSELELQPQTQTQ